MCLADVGIKKNLAYINSQNLRKIRVDTETEHWSSAAAFIIIIIIIIIKLIISELSVSQLYTTRDRAYNLICLESKNRFQFS